MRFSPISDWPVELPEAPPEGCGLGDAFGRAAGLCDGEDKVVHQHEDDEDGYIQHSENLERVLPIDC
jgi:hypothetical protein